jgi:hypothetical protein
VSRNKLNFILSSSRKGMLWVLSTYIHNAMLVTIAAILVILWLLGLVTSYTLGGFIHILLVIAIIVVLVRLIRGENPIA